MLASPCYDKRTRTDCPLRTIYCKATCLRWQTYEDQKRLEYAVKKQEAERAHIDIYYMKRKIAQMKRRLNKK